MSRKFLLIGLLLPFFALAYSSPGKPTGYVNDFAGVLKPEQKQALETKLSAFEKETSNEIAVVTVPDLSGDTVENYAVELFKEWGIGRIGKDNGVLILAALKDRKMRIEVGYGLEGALTDAQSSWIINNLMKPAFRAGDFYTGIDSAADKIISATKGEYVPAETDNQIGRFSNGSSIPFIFWLTVIFLTTAASILGRSKSWWAGGIVGGVIGIILGFINGFLFFGIISVAVLIPLGLLFDFLVSRSYGRAKESGRYPWWFGGGSGGSGGSGSDGGGFGGFGGGSSGGGGASGDW